MGISWIWLMLQLAHSSVKWSGHYCMGSGLSHVLLFVAVYGSYSVLHTIPVHGHGFRQNSTPYPFIACCLYVVNNICPPSDIKTMPAFSLTSQTNWNRILRPTMLCNTWHTLHRTNRIWLSLYIFHAWGKHSLWFVVNNLLGKKCKKW